MFVYGSFTAQIQIPIAFGCFPGRELLGAAVQEQPGRLHHVRPKEWLRHAHKDPGFNSLEF